MNNKKIKTIKGYNTDTGGVWRTIGGRRIFIKDGQSLSEAMIESGKYKTTKQTIKELNELNYTNETQFINDLEKESELWWNKIEDESKRYIKRYTGGLDKDINNYLNGKENEISNLMKPIVKKGVNYIDKALNKFKNKQNMIVYKEINSRDVFNKNIDFSNLEEYRGKIIINKGYLSTSITEIGTSNFKRDSIIKFKVSKDIKGAYLGNKSHYEYEKEFLIHRNCKYVINNLYNNNGKLQIEAIIIE